MAIVERPSPPADFKSFSSSQRRAALELNRLAVADVRHLPLEEIQNRRARLLRRIHNGGRHKS